jgi:hypothetical protein
MPEGKKDNNQLAMAVMDGTTVTRLRGRWRARRQRDGDDCNGSVMEGMMVTALATVVMVGAPAMAIEGKGVM